MNQRQFMNRMLDAFPEAQVEEDNDGQLVVYTGLCIAVDLNKSDPNDWEVIPMKEEVKNNAEGDN